MLWVLVQSRRITQVFCSLFKVQLRSIHPKAEFCWPWNHKELRDLLLLGRHGWKPEGTTAAALRSCRLCWRKDRSVSGSELLACWRIRKRLRIRNDVCSAVAPIVFACLGESGC